MSLGLILVFGVLLAPLYLVLAGWIFGEPKDTETLAIGLAFMTAIILGPIIFSFVPISFRVIIP